jgi:endonuclease YncB( thermonuclease family)
MRPLLLFLALSYACGAWAGDFTARVIVVLDGDTLLVLRGKQKLKVRLANIDAPEKEQAGGMASEQSLAELVQDRQVQVSSRAVDVYGRIVGLVTVGNTNVNEEQLRRGMAWEYSRFHGNQAYVALQRSAQNGRRGLWAQTDPTPPWQWRKRHPRTESSSANSGVSRLPPAARPLILPAAASITVRRCDPARRRVSS